MTDTRTPIAPGHPRFSPALLVRRISRLEWSVAAVVAVVFAGLIIAEPEILEAPFENGRSMLFTVGGTAVAAVALAAMLWLRVPPAVRIVVLVAPFAAVSWWLISPFFIDDVVNDDFATSIADAGLPAASNEPPDDGQATPAGDVAPPVTEATPSIGPALLGAGEFLGLAGHSGTGDAGFFADDDGSLVLRLENLDIQNGPDLRLYVVPGSGRTAPDDGSLYLGELRGNVGNQTYGLPPEFSLTEGDWTVLVWCEAFQVEFVGATISVS